MGTPSRPRRAHRPFLASLRLSSHLLRTATRRRRIRLLCARILPSLWIVTALLPSPAATTLSVLTLLLPSMTPSSSTSSTASSSTMWETRCRRYPAWGWLSLSTSRFQSLTGQPRWPLPLRYHWLTLVLSGMSHVWKWCTSCRRMASPSTAGVLSQLCRQPCDPTRWMTR